MCFYFGIAVPHGVISSSDNLDFKWGLALRKVTLRMSICYFPILVCFRKAMQPDTDSLASYTGSIRALSHRTLALRQVFTWEIRLSARSRKRSIGRQLSTKLVTLLALVFYDGLSFLAAFTESSTNRARVTRALLFF